MSISKNSQAVSDYRRNRKLNLIRVCGNKCNLCGYQKNVAALEFHHINPELKNYGIATNGNCHNIHKDLEEVKKCILVCANCHREIHSGNYTMEELYEHRIYDEQIEAELTFIKKDNLFCKQCGSVITYSSSSGYCETCYHLSTRKCERPDRETLKHLIQILPFVQIGKQYGVSDNAVKKWCKNYNLPYRKIDIKQITDWSEI